VTTTATTARLPADQPAVAGDAWYCLSPEEVATLTTLTTDTFDNARMNWISLAELALAVMVTQMDLFNRLLDTTPLKVGQFGLALASAVLLFALWEAGKLIARRRASAPS
jgi:hypothetical protein